MSHIILVLKCIPHHIGSEMCPIAPRHSWKGSFLPEGHLGERAPSPPIPIPMGSTTKINHVTCLLHLIGISSQELDTLVELSVNLLVCWK